ncbi:MAG: helix-turn-helix transcriptional regulator [Acidobacteria bacterium]|nr:helix-turn-helix transcriptional regulator [Acidobacteriota bacterium]
MGRLCADKGMEPAGVVLLGPDQTALAMNSLAAQLWDSDDLVEFREGFCSPRLQLLDGKWFKIERGCGCQPLLACITSLTDGGFSQYRVLSIYDPERSIEITRSALQQAYRFTKAELRLVEQLLLGRTPAEAATALGVTIHTVRTYLKRLFHKVGVRSQATLVRRLVQISNVALPCPVESTMSLTVVPEPAAADRAVA